MKKQPEENKPEYPTEAYGAIPAFNNIEEEAEFWDTHDTTEFEDQFKPVGVRFSAPHCTSEAMCSHLSPLNNIYPVST